MQKETIRQWKNSHIVKCRKDLPENQDKLANHRTSPDKGTSKIGSILINGNIHEESVETV